MSNIWKFVILVVGSYLIGNITFARLFARTRNNDDITTHGSGNPGTMNMLRTHGVTMAVITLIFDALKSVVVCIAGYFWLKASGEIYFANMAIYAAGLSCIIGHMFPVIYKFKGGKGVATGFGMACVARPILIPALLILFLVIFLVWRMGSLASLTCVVTFCIADGIWLLVDGYYAGFIILMVAMALIVYAHRGNIDRLFNNRENKIDLEQAVQKDKDYAKEQREKREERKKKRLNEKNNKNNE